MNPAPRDPMRSVWQAAATALPDGQKMIRWAGPVDLEYLYNQGFVDTDRFPLKEWIEAFADSRQADGSYLVSETQWLAKKKFRYEGRTDPPFNPLEIREGEWAPEELEELIRTKILPSTLLKKDRFDSLLENGKKMGRFVNGKYLITKPFKFGLKQLLDAYPSPRRCRELAVGRAMEKIKKKAVEAPPAHVPEPRPQTGFTAKPASEKLTVDKLNELLWKGKK